MSKRCNTARERLTDAFFARVCPFLYHAQLTAHLSETFRPCGGSFTTARRPLTTKTMAMACFDDASRVCLQRNMMELLPGKNSPAGVDGDFPSRASSLARRWLLLA